MSEATVVDSRLDKLEQDNQRLKLALGSLLLVLAAVCLIGAVMPQQIPEVIEAREFRVIGENGTRRAAVAADAIVYIDENGQSRAIIDALGIAYLDENGTRRAVMDAYSIGYNAENGLRRSSMDADGIGYFDENGNIRVQMNADGIAYVDENENIRAQMGSVQTVTPATGVVTRTPAQVVLYDAEFNVIWSALR
jgi:hypothetical protein